MTENFILMKMEAKSKFKLIADEIPKFFNSLNKNLSDFITNGVSTKNKNGLVMYQSDIKIFELIDMLKSMGVIRFDTDFCNKIKIPKQSLGRIKKGLAHFTAEHIQNICKAYNVNSNWIFDLENNTFRKSKNSIKTKVLSISMPATLSN